MSKIIFVPDLGLTPARVHRPTGTIFINSRTFSNYRDFEQKLIILHEKGHAELQTRSEIEADKFALEKFIGSEKCSLRKALSNFYTTLNMQNPEHVERYNAVLYFILKTDYFKYKNQKVAKILNQMEDQRLQQLLVEYLKKIGLTTLNDLTQEQRESLLADFMLSGEVQEILKAGILQETEMSNFDDFLGGLIGQFAKPLIEKANDFTNKAIIKVAGAVGVKDPKKLGIITTLVNPANLLSGGSKASQVRNIQDQNALDMAKLEQAQIADAKKQIGAGTGTPVTAGNANEQQAQIQAQLIAQQNEAQKAEEAKKKKKKMIIIASIAGGVVVIGIILFFVLRKK